VSRALNDLCPRFRPLAMEIIARVSEAKVPVMIVDTIRTEAEQLEALSTGVSWTTRSKHLPQVECCNLSHAIDIAPYFVFNLHGAKKLQWDAEDPVWQIIRRVAQSLPDVKWGVVIGGKQVDPGHIEYRPVTPITM